MKLNTNNNSNNIMSTLINLKNLSSKLQAYKNCIESNNLDWEERHEDDIRTMLENLPHGSGLDAEVEFNWKQSNSNKLVFEFNFHYMAGGYYTGWTKHKLTITPTFGSFEMRISGENRNGIKEYLYDLFSSVFEVK